MTKKTTFREKLADNSLAIISLVIAITALTYNSWRADTSENNRNIRVASFELIKELGQLQNLTNQLHFTLQPDSKMRDISLINGWGHIALIEDLSTLLPSSIEQHAKSLKKIWEQTSSQLGTEGDSEKLISSAIESTRDETRKLLRSLD